MVDVTCQVNPLDWVSVVLFIVCGGLFLFADFSFEGETKFLLNVFFLFIWTVDAATFFQLAFKESAEEGHRLFTPYLKLVTLAAPCHALAIAALYSEDKGQVLLMAGWICAVAAHVFMYFEEDGGKFGLAWEGVVAVFVDFMMCFASKVWTVDGIGGFHKLGDVCCGVNATDCGFEQTES
mmetsp:Transcript_49775/g.113057  ORF Transcript_49775/g.113057 Transcript_49775/m.113057 type:complete len:180 (+) Transcript_49775:39-578(+)